MRNLSIIVFVLFTICWKSKVVKSTWPQTSSNLKLIGFFPEEITEESDDGLWIIHCRSMFHSALVLSQKYEMKFNGEYLTSEEIFTDNEIMFTFNKTCEKVLKSNIIGFIGPSSSNEARYVSSFAHRLGIVDISYSSTSSDLSTIDTGAFYRTSSSDENLVLALQILFEQFQWKSCLIIYQNDEYGYNGMHLLSQKLSEKQIKIFETIKFDINQQNLQIDLKKTLSNSLSRLIIVWANIKSTKKILNKALDKNLIGQDFLWILTTTVSLKDFNKDQKEKLIGILSIEPFQENVINSSLLNQAMNIWKTYEPETFPEEKKISIYALMTFDATWSLILSLKELCSNKLFSCLDFLDVSDCYNRRFLNSQKYYQTIQSIKFLGVSGYIQFVNGTPDRFNTMNYLIKNIQPINLTENDVNYVPVLQWNSNSIKWNQINEIFWPNRSKNIPKDHKLIYGQKIRIGIIESPPSIILKNSKKIYENMKDNYQRINLEDFDGFYKDFLMYLEEKMGFIPEIILAKPSIPYDKLVSEVANDSFDIVMSSIDINAKRNQIVDFSNAIMPASYRIVIRKSQLNYFHIFKPFLWALWLLLLIIIPYTNILIWIIEKKTLNKQNKESLFGIMIVISYPIYNLFRTNSLHIKTNAGRFLSSILWILQFILLIVHTAGLISFLIPLNSKIIISGIDDIKNGIFPRNRIGILVGSQIEEYYLNSISHGKKDYFPLKTPDEVYTKLISGEIDASLWSNISTAYHINNLYCQLMTVGVEFSHSFYQLPMKRGWLYTEDFNWNILSFMESEQIDRISAKWFGIGVAHLLYF
ncbi:unnamed protein product [Adineta ricciae]|uniref:Uncharacterized protein n=1 Tax=Adineta ricciae TaxID=249248 RepID=A0A815I5C0_ADIRI|nr:unnamed protein product [Adineta ricciae]